MKKPSLWSLLKKVHENEEGAVSLETVLIIGAIALPILILLLWAWNNKIKPYFNQGLDNLEAGSNTAQTP
ncbi:MAG: hypothetical protein IT426_02230 [Pirellulales bacterium]|nr:hypothetical protein [Pirellulales bacterium]